MQSLIADELRRPAPRWEQRRFGTTVVITVLLDEGAVGNIGRVLP